MINTTKEVLRSGGQGFTFDQMNTDLYIVVRWIHAIAAAAWFGEVVVINFVLIPTLSKYQGVARKDFLNTIFPRVFRLASVLALTTAITGGVLLYHYVGFEIGQLFERGSWGISIFIGGLMGLILTLFHFFMENLLAKRIGVGDPNISETAVEDVHLKLKLVPRLGLVVITVIFVMMMNAKYSLILW